VNRELIGTIYKFNDKLNERIRRQFENSRIVFAHKTHDTSK